MLPSTDLGDTKHPLLSITNAQSHLSMLGGFSQDPVTSDTAQTFCKFCKRASPSPRHRCGTQWDAAYPQQGMEAENLLAPAHVPRGDALGMIPPACRLPGPRASGGCGQSLLQPPLLQAQHLCLPLSLQGTLPKALAPPCSPLLALLGFSSCTQDQKKMPISRR